MLIMLYCKPSKMSDSVKYAQKYQDYNRFSSLNVQFFVRFRKN